MVLLGDNMVQIQVDLPEFLDKVIRHYMIDNDIEDRREAILEILNKALVDYEKKSFSAQMRKLEKKKIQEVISLRERMSKEHWKQRNKGKGYAKSYKQVGKKYRTRRK